MSTGADRSARTTWVLTMLLLYCRTTPDAAGIPSRLSSRVLYHQRIAPSPSTSRSRTTGDSAAACRGDLAKIARVRPSPSSGEMTAMLGTHAPDATGAPADAATARIRVSTIAGTASSTPPVRGHIGMIHRATRSGPGP